MRHWNTPEIGRDRPYLTSIGCDRQDATMLANFKILLAAVLLVVSGAAPAGAGGVPKPVPGDRCAVCGMFVVNHPDWLAAVVFADGSRSFFDGPKDLFRYLHDLEKHGAEGKTVAQVWVTDYYRVGLIDAADAFFVAGSDVMGPMGPELVPLATREEAETFARDHGGGAVLAFDEITPDRVPR